MCFIKIGIQIWNIFRQFLDTIVLWSKYFKYFYCSVSESEKGQKGNINLNNANDLSFWLFSVFFFRDLPQKYDFAGINFWEGPKKSSINFPQLIHYPIHRLERIKNILIYCVQQTYDNAYPKKFFFLSTIRAVLLLFLKKWNIETKWIKESISRNLSQITLLYLLQMDITNLISSPPTQPT